MKQQNGPQGNLSPERQYFERAVKIENERADLATDLKALWEEARRDPELDAKELKALKRAVKLHIEDPERKARRERTERDAQELLQRLGFLSTTPLGRAAMAAAGVEYDPETGEIA